MDKKSGIGKEERLLLMEAAEALKNAHVLWGFGVGAAVLAEDGKIYGGCNVESWVSGLGMCAERCAIHHAVLHGNKKIREIAVVVKAENKSEIKPCGACLQHISDFAENPEIKIVTAKVEDGKVLFETVKVNRLKELLPQPFKK
ncbi:MAG: cytidine deaminase [Candidatus Bathyarchaeota archaeon]|nr:cytidine deaminase [Candidatus Bathyarchaeota archaeon]MDW8039886.1 cytidine deaminase [Nitrososphaerota archaeon]